MMFEQRNGVSYFLIPTELSARCLWALKSSPMIIFHDLEPISLAKD